MKKLIILIALLAVGLSTFAQTGSAVELPLIIGDTLINTGTTSRVIKSTGGYTGVIIQVNAVLTSGTGAGTLTLSGSLDGVNYKTIGSAYTITNTASQSAQFSVLAPLPTFLKIAGAGGTTENLILTYWYRNPLHQTQ